MDYKNNKNVLVLKWGKNIVEKPPIIIKTELGTCVAVIFYDTVKKIGGMTHIVLPKSREVKSTTYADVAVKELIEDMMDNYDCKKKNIICKIYGGGQPIKLDMLINVSNLAQVRRELDKLSISIMEFDIGGDKGRVIYFDISTGDVIVEKLEHI